MKCCVVILTFQLLVSGLYALYSDQAGEDCDNDSVACYSTYATIYSLYNVKNDGFTVYNQQWLNLGVVVGLSILLQLMRYQMRLMSEECDQRDLSASDYTLFVENIPKNLQIDYERELKTFFENVSLGATPSNFIVEKINLAYDLVNLAP